MADENAKDIVKMSVKFTKVKEHISKKSGKTLLNVMFKLDDEFRPFVSAYLCFEGDGYQGFAVEKAGETWKTLTDNNNTPKNTTEAIQRSGEIKNITHVTVDYSGPFPEIKSFVFGDGQAGSEASEEEDIDIPF